MDIYTLQAIEALRANSNVQTGGKFGVDAYGKVAGLYHIATRGYTRTHTRSSFNAADHWLAYVAEIVGARANGSGTTGASTQNTTHAGHRLTRPTRRFIANVADKNTGSHVLSTVVSDSSGGYSYGNTATAILPIKNTSNSDISLTMYGVASSYTTHAQRFMWTLVPNNTDKASVTDTTFTVHTSGSNGTSGEVQSSTIVFPAGKTIILGQTGSAHYLYQQHQAGYNLTAGFHNVYDISGNANLETDYDMLAAIENRAATPDYTATTEALNKVAIATLWPNSLESMDLTGKVGVTAA